jgi:hypothetical protein
LRSRQKFVALKAQRDPEACVKIHELRVENVLQREFFVGILGRGKERNKGHYQQSCTLVTLNESCWRGGSSILPLVARVHALNENSTLGKNL